MDDAVEQAGRGESLSPPTAEELEKLREYAREVEDTLQRAGGCYRRSWGQDVPTPSYLRGILDTLEWVRQGGEHPISFGYFKTLRHDLETPPEDFEEDPEFQAELALLDERCGGGRAGHDLQAENMREMAARLRVVPYEVGDPISFSSLGVKGTCSEAVGGERVEGNLIWIDFEQWRAWPWRDCEGGWPVAGVVRVREGGMIVASNGAEFYLLEEATHQKTVWD